MKRDPHFHDSVFRVAWVATFQQVCDDALVLLRDVTLDVGDSRLNVLSSRDHCPAPRSHADTPHPRVTKMCATTQDVLNLWVRRGLFNCLVAFGLALLWNIPGRGASKLAADLCARAPCRPWNTGAAPRRARRVKFINRPEGAL